MRLSRTTRPGGREPLAVLATTVCVLAALGCDTGSPLAPDFGVDETPAPHAAEEGASKHEAPASEPVTLPDTDASPESDALEADVPADAQVPAGEAAPPLRAPTSSDSAGRVVLPLIVIDGIVQPDGFALSEANVGHLDIDHVEVVKGAAARMLYGPRGENGVVEIRTKRGTRAAVLAVLTGRKPR